MNIISSKTPIKTQHYQNRSFIGFGALQNKSSSLYPIAADTFTPHSPLVITYRNTLQNLIHDGDWLAFNHLWNTLSQPHRADIAQHQDADNTTLLHHAVQFPDTLPLIQALLALIPQDQRASIVNQPNLEGKTPLQLLEFQANEHYEDDETAMRENYLAIANILITNGANPQQLSDEFRQEVLDYRATD